MTKPTVLVTGATGTQGGAVTEALLSRGMRVRALVRDPSSNKAQAWAGRGVELIRGDLNDEASVATAASGVDSVFINTTPFARGVGIDKEIAQGRTIVRALETAKVEHIVYSSVSDANRNTGVPHFDSKWDAEKHLAKSGLPVTVTAPVYFADNVLMGWNIPDLEAGRFRQALPPHRKLQVVSVRDIGRFNAAVIERGSQLAGQRINYAGDELTPTQMAESLSRHTGRTIEFEPQPIDEVRAMSEDMALMFEWFDRVGYTADLAGLRAEFPEVEWMSFDDWARAQDWSKILA